MKLLFYFGIVSSLFPNLSHINAANELLRSVISANSSLQGTVTIINIPNFIRNIATNFASMTENGSFTLSDLSCFLGIMRSITFTPRSSFYDHRRVEKKNINAIAVQCLEAHRMPSILAALLFRVARCGYVDRSFRRPGTSVADALHCLADLPHACWLLRSKTDASAGVGTCVDDVGISTHVYSDPRANYK